MAEVMIGYGPSEAIKRVSDLIQYFLRKKHEYQAFKDELQKLEADMVITSVVLHEIKKTKHENRGVYEWLQRLNRVLQEAMRLLDNIYSREGYIRRKNELDEVVKRFDTIARWGGGYSPRININEFSSAVQRF